MSPGEVRPARPRDLDRLAALFDRLLAHHADAGPRFAVRPGREGEIRALLEPGLAGGDQGLWVFDADGDLLGFCLARVSRRPALFVET